MVKYLLTKSCMYWAPFWKIILLMEVINGPKRNLKNLIIIHLCKVKNLFGLSFWVVKKCVRMPLTRTTAVIYRYQLYYLVFHLWIWWMRHGPDRLPENRTLKNKCSVLSERGMECKKSLLGSHGNSKKICLSGFLVWKTSYGNNVGLLIMPTVCITVLYQLLVFYWSWMRLLFSTCGILSLT